MANTFLDTPPERNQVPTSEETVTLRRISVNDLAGYIGVGSGVVWVISALLVLFGQLHGVPLGVCFGLLIAFSFVLLLVLIFIIQKRPSESIGSWLPDTSTLPTEKLERKLKPQNEGELEELRNRIAELEGEKGELQRQINNLNAGVETYRETEDRLIKERDLFKGERDSLQAGIDARKWEHESANDELKHLKKFVLVDGCVIKDSSLSEGELFIDFNFSVLNLSMFTVSISMSEFDVIKGSIFFRGKPLNREAKLIGHNVNHLLSPDRRDFTIRQWVNESEARDIAETLKTSGNLFDFSRANVYISVKERPDKNPVSLDLTRVMERVSLENKIVELGKENSRLSEGITLWNSRASKIGELTRTLGMFYLAYNQTEQREVLSKDTGNNLKGRFMQALNYCFHVNRIVDAYSDNLPAFPNSFNKQRTWIDAQCFILRRLIEEQKQGLADYIKDEPIVPTSSPHPAQQEEIISNLLSELASLKSLLEEQKDILEAVSHDLTFEIDEEETQVTFSGGRRIQANVKLRCHKGVERALAVREIHASLHRQQPDGEETIIPREGAIVAREYPAMKHAEIADGWTINEPISAYRYYMFFLDVSSEVMGRLSRDYFLRVSLYEGTKQNPFTIDFYVNDWQSARQTNSSITLKP
jgi:hypothetical protein